MKIKHPNVRTRNKVNISMYSTSSLADDGWIYWTFIPLYWQFGSFPRNPHSGTSAGGPSCEPGQWISARVIVKAFRGWNGNEKSTHVCSERIPSSFKLQETQIQFSSIKWIIFELMNSPCWSIVMRDNFEASSDRIQIEQRIISVAVAVVIDSHHPSYPWIEE